MEKTGASAIIKIGGVKVSSFTQFDGHGPIHKVKFKVGDVVRILEDTRADNGSEVIINTLAVIVKTLVHPSGNYYDLVSLQEHGSIRSMEEESLKLVLSVEDLIKVANNNMV